MKNIKKDINKNKVLSLTVDGIIIGLFAGLSSVLYRIIITNTNKLRDIIFSSRDLPHILMYLLLFSITGIIIAKLLKFAPLSGGSGIPQIRGEVLGKLHMNPERVLFSKLIGGGLGSLVGLSLGREGPSIQIGGAISKIISKILKRDSLETSFMITAGASAGLAAAFNAPIAATLFALEEVHKSFSRYILIPCISASAIASFVSYRLLGQDTSLDFTFAKAIPIEFLHYVFFLGIICGLAGALFNYGLLKSQDFYAKLKFSLEIRMVLLMIFALLVGYTFKFGTGGGHKLLESMAHNRSPLKLLIMIFIVKLLYTWISYGSGAQGGIFLPVLVIGGATGAIFFHLVENSLIETYYVNFVIFGMAGILTAVVRAPIMSILLVFEMTGSSSHFLALTIVSMVSYVVAELLRSEPIYESLFERVMKSFGHSEEESTDRNVIYEYSISNLSPCANKTLAEINFPANLIVIYIQRGANKIIPNGEDLILPGDSVTILTSNKDLFDVDEFFKKE